MTFARHPVFAAAAFGLVVASYSAGAASAQAPTASQKLDQSYLLLVKAQAVLASIVVRGRVPELDAAKASVDEALADVEAAKAAIGG